MQPLSTCWLPAGYCWGIGAGHTPREWDDIGLHRPAPGEHVVTVTDDRESAIEETASEIGGCSPADAERTPYVLVGSPAEMAAQLHAQADEYGITSYIIREPAVPAFERVLELL